MNCLRCPLFLNPNLSVARQSQLLSPSLFSYYLLYLLIRLRNHHLQFSFVKFASFISSSYQGKISQEKRIKIRRVFWEDKMSCKCEIFFGFPPLQRSFFFFNPVRRFINASYFLSLLLREVSVLTTSTPCSGISFPSLHPLMADILLLLVLQLLPCLKQTMSPHWHKTSIMSHLPPTLK